jgi:hypothetical protein
MADAHPSVRLEADEVIQWVLVPPSRAQKPGAVQDRRGGRAGSVESARAREPAVGITSSNNRGRLLRSAVVC